MTDWKKKIGVLAAFLGVTFLPALGSLAATGTAPPGYGAFPARFTDAPPGFSLVYFVGFSVFALFVLLFLVFPRWFGFRKAPPAPKPSRARLPWWFWLGVPVTLISWALMWARLDVSVSLYHYAFVPLAWGMIFVLDGIVFERTGGKSLMATRPGTFKLMVLVSCLSWFLFEYINFFVRENWYYPNATIFSNFGIVVWFFLGYTTVLTGIFQWYSLLRTLPRFSVRYSLGPRINPGRSFGLLVLFLGLGMAFLMGYFPYIMFWGIWVSLVPVLGAALILAGKRTLLNDIGESGDWTKVNLIAVATLLNGIFWELWNFGSNWFHHTFPDTPGFWKYSVPYVDVVHLFSEMPLLGYWGYLFFGVNCWILWNLASYFFGYNDEVEVVGETKP